MVKVFLMDGVVGVGVLVVYVLFLAFGVCNAHHFLSDLFFVQEDSLAIEDIRSRFGEVGETKSISTSFTSMIGCTLSLSLDDGYLYSFLPVTGVVLNRFAGRTVWSVINRISSSDSIYYRWVFQI